MSQDPSDRQRILVMRHPETIANVEHYFSGHKDVFLTKRGDEQRKRAIKALVSWKPDRIWCSPLSRCLSIAAPAAEYLGMEVVIDERLAEIEFGDLEGNDIDYAREHGYRFPWPIDQYGVSHPCPGGESFETLLARAGSLLDSLRPLEGRTACISHGGFTRAILGAVYGSDKREFWNYTITNVSSQILTTDGKRFFLDAFGLTPEEVMRRMYDPDSMNEDSINNSGEDR